MEKLKSIVKFSTIITTCITSLLLILVLFGINLFGKENWNVILTFACLSFGCFFIINSLNMLVRNKILGFVSLVMICLSVFLIIIATWIDIDSLIFIQVTSSLGLASVLFNIIVSSGLEFGKNKLLIQIIVYFIVAITDIVASLGIFGIINLLDIIAWFVSLIILSVLGVVVLKVLAKKSTTSVVKDDPNIIKISKSQYDILVDKASKYDAMISKIEESKK